MESKKLRIVFMGTPHFAVGILSELVRNKYNVVGVITVADKPAGRGKQIAESPVKRFAQKESIPVLQPTNLKNEEFLAQLASLQPDLQIVVAFRMLPKTVWSIPKYGTFNLHASLLPAYRGAAPINWAIINGEKETGVTTFFIDEKIDTGEIIMQDRISIDSTDTFETLHDKLNSIGSQLVLKTVDLISTNGVKTIPQPEIAPSLAPKLFKENCKVNWKLKSEEIYNFIRGLNPYPAAWSSFENNGIVEEMKIFKSRFVVENHTYILDSIIASKKELKIAIKDGFLFIDELQLPSKKKMDAKSLLNGYIFSENAKVL